MTKDPGTAACIVLVRWLTNSFRLSMNWASSLTSMFIWKKNHYQHKAFAPQWQNETEESWNPVLPLVTRWPTSQICEYRVPPSSSSESCRWKGVIECNITRYHNRDYQPAIEAQGSSQLCESLSIHLCRSLRREHLLANLRAFIPLRDECSQHLRTQASKQRSSTNASGVGRRGELER